MLHHKDGNKLNALKDNIELLSKGEHILIHRKQWGHIDFRSEDGKWRGIQAAMIKNYRSDITKQKITELVQKGMSKAEIANYFNCGKSTLDRRLYGREYKTTSTYINEDT